MKSVDYLTFRVLAEDVTVLLKSAPLLQQDLNKLFVITDYKSFGIPYLSFAFRKNTKKNRSLLFDIIKRYHRIASSERAVNNFGNYIVISSFANKLIRCLL